MKTKEYTSSPSTSDHFSKGEGPINEAALGAHQAIDKTAAAVDDAARRAIPALDRAASYAHQVVDKAANAATPAVQWLNEQAKVLTTNQKEIVSRTRDYVVANPWQSLGMALAAGFVISRLLRK